MVKNLLTRILIAIVFLSLVSGMTVKAPKTPRRKPFAQGCKDVILLPADSAAWHDGSHRF
jgi:hypothetical protein